MTDITEDRMLGMLNDALGATETMRAECNRLLDADRTTLLTILDILRLMILSPSAKEDILIAIDALRTKVTG